MGFLVATLILLRHGESEWNLDNRFAGWVDIELTERGLAQAAQAGRLVRGHGQRPDVVHTSLLRRSIRTAAIVTDATDRSWVPVRRSWRLNERHYGALQGADKAAVRERYGDEQFALWRRSYDVPPPPLPDDDELSSIGDPRYAGLAGGVPRTESLRDVTGRLLPHWFDAVVPDLAAGRTVLLVAHSNSLRALIKHLDRLSDDAVVPLHVPTGVPLLYTLDDAGFMPTRPAEYLDPDAAAAGIAEVAAQGSRPRRAAGRR
jgi:2,3-bisphosphoglycerate-dependent phosphoglycerate mutase